MKGYFVFLIALLALPLIALQQVFVANSTNDTVSVIDTITNTVTTTISLQGNTQPQSVTFSPDGSLVFVCCKGTNEVVVLSATTDSFITAIPIQGQDPYFTAFTPDGSKAYVTCFTSNSVSVIDVASLSVFSVITHNIGMNPFFCISSLDGKYVYITSNNGIDVIDTETNTTSVIMTGVSGEYATLSPNGTILYIAIDSPTNSVLVIDTTTNAVITSISTPGGTSPVSIAVTLDGSKGYVTNYTSNNVSILDLVNNTFVSLISANIGSEPNITTITPDGTQVYLTNTHSNNVSVIDTATDTAQLITTGSLNGPYWIVAAPEGSNVYLTNFANGSTNITQINTQSNVGTGITVGTKPYFLAVTPIPIATVSGIPVKNRFLAQTDVVNVISWTACGFNPTQYDVYRDIALTELIGSVSSSGPLVFYDHNRILGQAYSYYIVSVNQQGAGTTRVGNVTITSH